MKTQKVFIDTTTTVSESKNNQMTNTGYFQHKARIPEISLNTALYRQVAHHLFIGIILETKLTLKKKRYQALLVKEVLVHNCTDIKQRISHSKQDIFTVRESSISR